MKDILQHIFFQKLGSSEETFIILNKSHLKQDLERQVRIRAQVHTTLFRPDILHALNTFYIYIDIYTHTHTQRTKGLKTLD